MWALTKFSSKLYGRTAVPSRSTVSCAMLRQTIVPPSILARVRHCLRNTGHLVRALALRLCLPRVHGGHLRPQRQEGEQCSGAHFCGMFWNAANCPACGVSRDCRSVPMSRSPERERCCDDASARARALEVKNMKKAYARYTWTRRSTYGTCMNTEYSTCIT